jgi:MraZ protein
LELDNNGRAVIPPNLREFAGLEKDVVIMGVSDRVEIWDSKEWDAMEASVCTEDVTKLMIELGL